MASKRQPQISRKIEVAASTKAPKFSRDAAREVLWRKGILDFKLDTNQNEMKRKYYTMGNKVQVWLLSRRTGKSTTLCAVALETCIRKPGAIVKFLAPEAKQTKTIIKPIIQDLIQDCPEDLRPSFKQNEGIYRFPNGSEIHIAGSDGGGAERLRGTKADLCIVDEAGFCNDLNYAVRTILLPTLLTTNGKLLLSSTPPTDAEHDFLEFIAEAEAKGTLTKKTIYDCPRFTPELIEKEIISSYPGGANDPDFKREYCCELVRDENLLVIPEFTETIQSKIVADLERPPFYDRYVAADWGVSDLTVVLFGYYDFKEAKIVIEDEVVMNGVKMNTAILASAIKQKERELWRDDYSNEPLPVYMRVCDNNLLLMQDMQTQHGLTFLATEKLGKEGYLNQLRVMVQGERVIISPKCKTLIQHLKYTQWNAKRTGFKRSASTSHGDALDALVYFIRNIVFSHNPYPGNEYASNMFVTPNRSKPAQSQAVTNMANIFKPRWKR